MSKVQITLASLLLLSFAGAACRMIAQDKTPSASGSFAYNVADQVTVEGTVQEVKDYKCPVSGTVGSHITLKSGSEAIEVHLAPVTYLKEYEMAFHAGESVKIVGVKILVEGKPALLAKSATVAGATFTFRDAKGRPLW